MEELFYSGRDSCSLSPLRPDKEIGPNSRKKEAEHSGCVSHSRQSGELPSQRCFCTAAPLNGLVGHVAPPYMWGHMCVLGYNSILTLTQTPQGKGCPQDRVKAVPQDCPHSDASCTSQVVTLLCSTLQTCKPCTRPASKPKKEPEDSNKTSVVY